MGTVAASAMAGDNRELNGPVGVMQTLTSALPPLCVPPEKPSLYPVGFELVRVPWFGQSIIGRCVINEGRHLLVLLALIST